MTLIPDEWLTRPSTALERRAQLTMLGRRYDRYTRSYKHLTVLVGETKDMEQLLILKNRGTKLLAVTREISGAMSRIAILGVIDDMPFIAERMKAQS